MCIRDSSTPVLDLSTTSGGLNNNLQTCLTATRFTEGLGNICLLYTSDAADERSSVDLGGRRIIKKKKITV